MVKMDVDRLLDQNVAAPHHNFSTFPNRSACLGGIGPSKTLFQTHAASGIMRMICKHVVLSQPPNMNLRGINSGMRHFTFYGKDAAMSLPQLGKNQDLSYVCERTNGRIQDLSD